MKAMFNFNVKKLNTRCFYLALRIVLAGIIYLSPIFSGVAFCQPGKANWKLVGYGEGTKGGEGGKVVNVSTDTEFQNAINNKGGSPLIVRISGKLKKSSYDRIQIKQMSDITIEGACPGGGEIENITILIRESSNIIIRNLKIHHVYSSDEGDCISITVKCNHIWVDHCEFYNDRDHGNDYYDGLLDITHACDYITVSWCYFHDHYKGSLIGHTDDNSDEDKGHFLVTYHHNYFKNINSRTPSNRFGNIHFFNNYVADVPTSGVNTRMGACTIVEENHFERVDDPVCSIDSDIDGKWDLRDNLYDNCTGNQPTSSNCTGSVPYKYSDALADKASVKTLVTGYCGICKDNTTPVDMNNLAKNEMTKEQIHVNRLKNTITLNVSDEDANIEIYSLGGKRMMIVKNRTGNKITWDASALPDGIYAMKATIKEKMVNQTFCFIR